MSIQALLSQVVHHHHLSRAEEVFWFLHHHSHHFLLHEIVDFIIYFSSWWVWLDSHACKVAYKLSWNLSQDFFSKTIWIVLYISERNELDNISGGVFPHKLTVKRVLICIKLLHLVEISISDTHNDDRKWQS